MWQSLITWIKVFWANFRPRGVGIHEVIGLEHIVWVDEDEI